MSVIEGFAMTNANYARAIDLSLVRVRNLHPGANLHPGCKFAPGCIFGHVNGVLRICNLHPGANLLQLSKYCFDHF